jgi:hypothetical protein
MVNCVHHPEKLCWHSSCDFLDAFGNVVVCPLFPNPNGRFKPRIVRVQFYPVFSKHSFRRSR